MIYVIYKPEWLTEGKHTVIQTAQNDEELTKILKPLSDKSTTVLSFGRRINEGQIWVIRGKEIEPRSKHEIVKWTVPDTYDNKE